MARHNDPKSGYYDVGGLETINIVRAKLTAEQFIGYCLGNILKYACRLDHKGEAVRDSEKLVMYATYLRDELRQKG